ncbi:hypothetical protein Hanom_Chr00s000006g01612941 [Helianthus anomalus]
MVSLLYPIPPTQPFYSDSSPMVIPNIGSFSAPTDVVAPPSPADDASKKIRKPYTITKSRESWSDPEHDKFLEALQLSVSFYLFLNSRVSFLFQTFLKFC